MTSLIVDTEASAPQAAIIAEQFGLTLCTAPPSNAPYWLSFRSEGLILFSREFPHGLRVDFLEGKNRHRRLQGGGRQQPLARACLLDKIRHCNIIDATAGLGRDAFVFASLGANVTMLERNPVLGALLSSGLMRLDEYHQIQANNTPHTQEQSVHRPLPTTEQLRLQPGHARDHLEQLTQDSYPDVIYLDPMYPEHNNSALVKKEMRILRDVVGADEDAAELLHLARARCKYRVVVKRPRHGVFLGEEAPSHQLIGKSGRFDLYINAAYKKPAASQ